MAGLNLQLQDTGPAISYCHKNPSLEMYGNGYAYKRSHSVPAIHDSRAFMLLWFHHIELTGQG